MRVGTVLKGLGGAVAALVLVGVMGNMAGLKATPVEPQAKSIFDMTQAERKAAYEARKLAAVRENNLSRDAADRARVVCAFHRNIDADLDWTVTKRKGVWYVANLCKLRRNAEADLEVF